MRTAGERTAGSSGVLACAERLQARDSSRYIGEFGSRFGSLHERTPALPGACATKTKNLWTSQN